jgi:hypothetical protein
MSEKVSDAAGRVVYSLSRRRFLTWVGGAGAALAAGLGLDQLGSTAFAARKACNRITFGRPFPGVMTTCVPKDECGDISEAHRLFRECGRRHRGECAEGEHCGEHPFPEFKHCKPALSHPFSLSCHQVPAEECRPAVCGHNEVCCKCETTGDPPPRLQCKCSCQQ